MVQLEGFIGLDLLNYITNIILAHDRQTSDCSSMTFFIFSITSTHTFFRCFIIYTFFKYEKKFKNAIDIICFKDLFKRFNSTLYPMRSFIIVITIFLPKGLIKKVWY